MCFAMRQDRDVLWESAWPFVELRRSVGFLGGSQLIRQQNLDGDQEVHLFRRRRRVTSARPTMPKMNKIVLDGSGTGVNKYACFNPSPPV